MLAAAVSTAPQCGPVIGPLPSYQVTTRLAAPPPPGPAPQSNEADNLQRVVRELSEGRAKVAVQRAMLADKYADLQQEYHRMLRIADLSRTVR